MRHTRFGFLFIVLTFISLETQAQKRPLEIVTSFSILSDVIKNIGASDVHVKSLVGPNSDPHAFEPSPKDAAQIFQADLVIINGLNLEPWMQKLVDATGFQGQILVLSEASEIIDLNRTHDEPTTPMAPYHTRSPALSNSSADTSRPDPHLWHNAEKMQEFVQKIARTICNLRPDLAQAVHQREREYLKKLKLLDSSILQAFSFALRGKRCTVATLHAGFDAFQKRYGLYFVSPLGFDTQAEASARELAGIIELIRHGHVSGLFVENITNPNLIRQIADETHRATDGTLYSDALSGPEGPAATYIDLMRHNATILLQALYRNGCKGYAQSKDAP